MDYDSLVRQYDEFKKSLKEHGVYSYNDLASFKKCPICKGTKIVIFSNLSELFDLLKIYITNKIVPVHDQREFISLNKKCKLIEIDDYELTEYFIKVSAINKMIENEDKKESIKA